MLTRRRFLAMAGGLLALLPPVWWIFRPDRRKELRTAALALLAADAEARRAYQPYETDEYKSFDLETERIADEKSQAASRAYFEAVERLAELMRRSDLDVLECRGWLFVMARTATRHLYMERREQSDTTILAIPMRLVGRVE